MTIVVCNPSVHTPGWIYVRSSRITLTDYIGLPPMDHGIWLLGHEQLRIALAICDAFAALRRRHS